MNIGIVGCGNISDTYFESQEIFKNLNIVSCADIIKDFADQKANKYGEGIWGFKNQIPKEWIRISYE